MTDIEQLLDDITNRYAETDGPVEETIIADVFLRLVCFQSEHKSFIMQIIISRISYLL